MHTNMWTRVGALGLATVALALGLGTPEARAGKPGGTIAPPGGTIVLAVQGATVGAEYWATDTAGNARPLGITWMPAVQTGSTKVGRGFGPPITQRDGVVWMPAVRRYQEYVLGTDGTWKWVVRRAELLAVQEGDIEVLLFANDAGDLRDVCFAGNGAYVAYVDGSTETGHVVMLASLTWASGRPALVAPPVVWLERAARPLAPSLSSDATRIVFRDGVDLWAGTRSPSGAWSLQVIASGYASPTVLISPDGRRVLYEHPDGIRIVNIDGTGSGLVLANSGEGSAALSGTFVRACRWSPDSAYLAYYWYRSNSSDSGVCWAPAKARSKGTPIAVPAGASTMGWVP